VAKTATAKRRENAILRYFRETYFELKKVSWPTRPEAVNLTIIVVLVTTFLSIALAILDWLFSTGFEQFFKLFV
jgi:preprotein translocase subunit SecE